MNLRPLLAAIVLVVSFSTPPGRAADFEPLFNGRDLSGWRGLDGLWSVEDGAIVGRTTKENPIEGNTFLVWQGGEVADFEFVAQVRFKGVNSGVQYRSVVLDAEKFVLSGYQLDLHPSPVFYGMLYGEKYGTRGKIATRGERVEVDAQGKVMKLGKVGDDSKFTDWEWNTLRIVAVGSRLIHQVNGVTTIDVTDHDPSAMAKGVLGLQLHKGGPMRVEFKELKLRALNAGQATSVLKEFAAATAASAAPVASKDETPKPKPRAKGKGKAKKAAAKVETTAGAPQTKTTGGFNVSRLQVAKSFKVEEIHHVPGAEQGSWVALTMDGKGRLLASDQGGKGLFRITLSAAGGQRARVEKMPVDISGAQGLVWQSGALYFSKSGEGIFRVTDSDGDDRLDKAELLSALTQGGEHGNHGVIEAGDGAHLFAMAGNFSPLPAKDSIVGKRPQSWQDDLLLPRQWDPRGHARGLHAPGGWFTRFDPAKRTHEVFCIGFRNQYDAALNAHGDLFTYDSDMEWDMGLPWYRPTRICHVVSGGDFGWRSGAGNSPTYYEDNLPPVLEIGPGSPTGVAFGTGAKFPAKYQRAMYALDWTYGRILAIHLRPEGASYQAESEVFVSGAPLPVTDAVVGRDGAMYFTIGGRGTQSALMRVTYTGGESTAAAAPESLPKEAVTRRELEAFHGVANPKAVEAAWPHLASADRFLRNAARVAIESQPVATWAEKVFAEKDTQARITAAVAMARSGTPANRERLLKHLLALDFKSLPTMQKLGVLRAISLTIDRLGKPTESERAKITATLDPFLPGDDAAVNSEILRLLVYLNAPSAVPKGMQIIANTVEAAPKNWESLKEANARYSANLLRISKNPPPTQRIRYAYTLRTAWKGWTPELRRQYFAFLNEAGKGSGGASYPGYLANIREEALTLCTDAERQALKDIIGRDFNPVPDFPITPPKGPGREWTMAEAVAATGSKALKQADWASGRNLFHAVGCGACHRFNGLGGGVGPDLTSVPNKCDTAYLLESILEPSKVISDQYGSSVVTLKDGRTLTGLVVEQDEKAFRVYPADLKAPGDLVQRAEVKSIGPSPVSQMPQGLINSLSEKELRELVGYIMSGGNPRKK